MYCNKYYNSLFYNLLLFNSLLISCFTQEPEWLMDDSALNEYIRANELRIANETTQLCNLPRKMKLAICSYIINKTHESSHIHLKYLNKIAFSLLNVDCVKKPVVFDREENYNLDIIIPKQYMMPCYGRNNPIRTSWIEDDFFDTIYIYAGISSTSFILLGHDRTRDTYYRPFALIEHLVPEKLPEVQINRNSLNEDLISLESVSANIYRGEIENIFIYEKYRSKLEKYDSVCNLKTLNKILLCEKVMSFGNAYFDYWILDKAAFNDDSSQCVEKTLRLIQKSKFTETGTIRQKMYPCHGQHSRFGRRERLWYLSAGHFENSVMLYMKEMFSSSYRIVHLYENVKLENLL